MYEDSSFIDQSKFLTTIPKIISDKENKFLMNKISKDEVTKVLFNMNPDKAPEPDGFPTFFYQKC